jgi:hypothetical protein
MDVVRTYRIVRAAKLFRGAGQLPHLTSGPRFRTVIMALFSGYKRRPELSFNLSLS